MPACLHQDIPTPATKRNYFLISKTVILLFLKIHDNADDDNIQCTALKWLYSVFYFLMNSTDLIWIFMIFLHVLYIIIFHEIWLYGILFSLYRLSFYYINRQCMYVHSFIFRMCSIYCFISSGIAYMYTTKSKTITYTDDFSIQHGCLWYFMVQNG